MLPRRVLTGSFPECPQRALVVCRSNRASVAPSHRGHLARRKAQSQSGHASSIFDAARGLEGRRNAVSIWATGH
jgi:hypothetical protein